MELVRTKDYELNVDSSFKEISDLSQKNFYIIANMMRLLSGAETNNKSKMAILTAEIRSLNDALIIHNDIEDNHKNIYEHKNEYRGNYIDKVIVKNGN